MDSNRAKPRPNYLAQSDVTPTEYDCDVLPPKLLILGTGGILVHREKPSPGRFSRTQTRPVIQRPFLTSLLAYCLDVQTSCFDKTGATAREIKVKADPVGPFSDRPYGKQFWTDTRMKKRQEFFHDGQDEEEKARIPLPEIKTAPYHVVIWTAAQIHNVNSNLTSIFGQSLEPLKDPASPPATPLQPLSSHLLRVYDRKTLQPESASSYRQKTPSCKDLEIVWRALNSNDETLLDAGKRFEREKQKGGRLKECIQAPWGPHNTVQVIDDAAEATAQPFNVLLVPEFDAQAAHLASTFRTKHPQFTNKDVQISEFEEEEERDRGDPSGLSAQDDVLLQLIGVLEAARWQKNVSSWIRDGHLGEFGRADNPKKEGHVSSDGKGKSCGDWALEGKLALEKRGIALRF